MDPRANRFCNWTPQSGYYERDSVLQNPFQTDQKMNTKFDFQYTAKSHAILSAQRNANKNQVVRADKTLAATGDSQPTGQNTLKKTVQMDTYIDQKAWVNIIQDAKDEDIWKQNFDLLAVESTNFEVAIKTNDIRKIVNNIFGANCPAFVADKFDKVGRDIQKDRLVRWDDFRLQISRVMAAIESECTQKAETPGLIKLMNRPRLVDPNLGPLGDISTVYRDTIVYRTTNEATSPGKTMSLTPASLTASTKLPKPVTEGMRFTKPMDPTSDILGAGTTKCTNKLPGYTGHIPRNTRNLVKADHAFGEVPHPVRNDLILTQANMGTTLNYTGHVSKYIATFGERTTACDPRTSNGAAYGPVRCML